MNSTNELPDLTRPFRRRAGRSLSATFVSWGMIGFKITSKEYDRYSAGTGTEIRFRTGVAIVCIGGISNHLSKVERSSPRGYAFFVPLGGGKRPFGITPTFTGQGYYSKNRRVGARRYEAKSVTRIPHHLAKRGQCTLNVEPSTSTNGTVIRKSLTAVALSLTNCACRAPSLVTALTLVPVWIAT